MFASTTFTMVAESIGMKLTAYVDRVTGEVSFRTLTGYEPVGFDPLGTLWSGTGALVSASGRDGKARMTGSSWTVATVARLTAREDHARHSGAIGLTYEEAIKHPYFGKTAPSVEAVRKSYSVVEQAA